MDARTLNARAERLGLTFSEAIDIMSEPNWTPKGEGSKAVDPFWTPEAEAAPLPF